METSGSFAVALAVIVGIATFGFLRATDPSAESSPLQPQRAITPSGSADVPVARSYREMRTKPQGAGSGWEQDMAALAALGPSRTEAVSLEGTDKSAAIAVRASRRAYDGAPPRIPHAIRQDSAAECLACHDTGVRFRGLVASPMSHAPFTSCTQCHVVDEKPMPGGGELAPDPRAVANTFVGVASPDGGPRAGSIAPPQIPHRTAMRERCESCHGVNGQAALRSTHPWRASCEQCHAAAAPSERRAGVTP